MDPCDYCLSTVPGCSAVTISFAPPTQTSISYAYDPLYRLTSANYTGSYTSTLGYAYDAVGNRTVQTQTITSTLVTNYTYDIANRLTNVNGQVYTWDNNGNLLNDGTSTFTYDQANRIKTLTQGTNSFAFAYNGVSDRISQTVGVTQTRYALDPAAGLTQVLSDGSATYLYGNGRIAQQQTNMQYFGADGLGSVRQLYNSSGQIIFNKRYDPFGNAISQSGVGASNYGFTGEWTDGTGLEYLRARYYAPGQGRFTTRDTWEGDYRRPETLNKWPYVTNNPVNLTDPSGQQVSLLPQLSQTLATGLVPGSGANLNLGANNSLLSVLGECWWNHAPPAAVDILGDALGTPGPIFDGYLFGVSLVVTSGPGHVRIHGMDTVYDFRHQQRAVFTYEDIWAINTTAIGIEVDAYEGLIHGFVKDVSDYKGPFVSGSAGVGIPLGKIFGISGSVAGFSSADESCRPNWQMTGVVVVGAPGIGASLPWVSASLTCTHYTMATFGRWNYPQGVAGGTIMAYEILLLGPFDPMREYAAELAMYYSVMNQAGQR